jgi:hypothetical protein
MFSILAFHPPFPATKIAYIERISKENNVLHIEPNSWSPISWRTDALTCIRRAVLAVVVGDVGWVSNAVFSNKSGRK